MKITELLNEGVNDQFLYHGVNTGNTMMQILKSGALEPQEPFEFDSDMDERNGKESLDRISLTRNQYLHFPYGYGVAQFVIDKNALLKHGYKVVPTVGAGMRHKAETEELVYRPIPIKAPFIVEIQYDPNLKIPEEFFNNAITMGVKVTPWRKSRQNSPATKSDNAPKPQNKYTDPEKLSIDDDGYTSGYPPNVKKVEPRTWQLGYQTDTHIDTIGPRSYDKAYIEKLYLKIKDRIAKKLDFSGLLPKRQFGKEWDTGYYEISPGNKEWKN